MNLRIRPSTGLSGSYEIPGDKSISHRALMVASLARGTSEIVGGSGAQDPRSTQQCLIDLGVPIETRDNARVVRGSGLKGFRASARPLDAGNSGTTMRLLSGIMSGQDFPSVIVGDESLSKRPMRRILDPLREMGAEISGTSAGTAPLRISPSGRLHGIRYESAVPSAQVKSAILLAGLYAEGRTEVVERIPTRDHTERMLGLRPERRGDSVVVGVEGGTGPEPRQFLIPGDFSAAMYLLVAALIVPHSSLTVKNVGINPTRAAALNILRDMNGNIEVLDQRQNAGEPVADIRAQSSSLRSDITLGKREVSALIDEIPILAIAALFAEGTMSVRSAEELRNKESDRIAALVRNIRALGNEVEEYTDGFAFESKRNLIGATIESFGDHRIAMAFGVAGLALPRVEIRDSDCVDISFPGFWKTIGA